MRLVKHFEQLLHLRTVVEQGSINRAARSIGLSQPALTRSIRRFEESLGVRLLERTAQGVVPTAFGELLINHARTIDSELRRATDALHILKGGGSGQLNCGGTIGAVNHLLPSVVAALQRERPNVRIRVIEAIPASLLAMVRTGELDLAVCARVGDVTEPDLIGEVLTTDRLEIMARAAHPLHQRKDHRLADLLAEQPWILPIASGSIYQVFHRHIESLGLAPPKRVCETSAIAMLRSLLLTTNQIAITTTHTMANEIKAGRIKPLVGEWSWPRSQTVVYQRNNAPPTSLTKTFLRLLRATARQAALSET